MPYLAVPNCLGMTLSAPVLSDYMDFYRFLPVMDGDQIAKLRRIAIGVLSISSFSDEEVAVLETKLQLNSLKD